MQYRKAEHGFTLTLHSDIPERKILRWRTELLKSATVAVTAVPMDFTVTCPPLAVCGEKLSLTVQGAELVGMMDRCGVFDETGAVRADLLDAYHSYGDFGLVNFARRTFAVQVRQAGVTVTVPVSVTVLPRYLFRAVWSAEDRAIRLHVTNRSTRDMATTLRLISGGIATKAPLTVPAGGEADTLIPFAGMPVPGRNRAQLCIPGVWSREITFDAPLDNTPEKLSCRRRCVFPMRRGGTWHTSLTMAVPSSTRMYSCNPYRIPLRWMD